VAAKLGLPARYAVCTLHRPANVDDPAILSRILGALEEIARDLAGGARRPPRTRTRMDALGLVPHGLTVIEPWATSSSSR
jgi:UDP-N-acetylglucosamine 2-epimerase (non-hydrolysing)